MIFQIILKAHLGTPVYGYVIDLTKNVNICGWKFAFVFTMTRTVMVHVILKITIQHINHVWYTILHWGYKQQNHFLYKIRQFAANSDFLHEMTLISVINLNSLYFCFYKCSLYLRGKSCFAWYQQITEKVWNFVFLF